MRRMHYMDMDEDFQDRFRGGPHGHGRHRARRGMLVMSILALLDEKPMHGYELITVLEERSGGRWKPSPGAIYPALGKLEARGLVTSTEQDGKRQYELTEDGRRVAAEFSKRTEGRPPWEQFEMGGQGDLKRALSELVGPARQIGRFGSASQVEQANAAIKEATAKLYKILADGPGE
jgi:DNA-binding PadR family transcriptional regulator